MDGDAALLRTLKRARPKSVWLAATMPRTGSDARRLAECRRLSAAVGVPLLATNDALYATAAQRPLHDIITCIREGMTVQKAGRLLRANGERHLKAPEEMARLFGSCPEAVGESAKLLARIRRSDEHTSELQSLMRISYAVFCVKTKYLKHQT